MKKIEFKKGDKVKCVDGYDIAGNIRQGEVYTVAKMEDGFVHLKAPHLKPHLRGGWWPHRFELVKVEKPEVYKAKPKAKRVALTAQNLTLRNLETAEDLFLRSNGWKPARGGGYRPPKGYETASIRQGNTYPRQHAVNSQRKMLGGT